MSSRLAGPLITAALLGGVGLILFLNLETDRPAAPSPATDPKPTPETASKAETSPGGGSSGAPFREYPIGDAVEANGMSIAAVWLPGVSMDGRSADDVIHLEADIKATKNNPNGFANEEFVPYLKVRYRIEPAAGGAAIHEGEMIPMVAADGLHYGASLDLPAAGSYRLTYAIDPPSAGGLGRHSDPKTGVAPWWAPFEVAFEWDYQGKPASVLASRP